MLNLSMQPNVILDIPTFWEGFVNFQLSKFNLTSCFRFPSMLVSLVLYFHVEKFMHLGLNIMDPHKRKNSVINWTKTVQIHPNYDVFHISLLLSH